MSSGKHEGLNLRVGELVEVKSEAEILATLDQDGTLHSLPFMPEMLKFCGRRFRVHKRADKTCDTIQGTWRRRMQDAVHFDLRCDGGAHDGCQARCLLFWKEAWLRRVDATQPMQVGPAGVGSGMPNSTSATNAASPCTREKLLATCRSVTEAGDRLYRCQTTELRNATSPLAWWHTGQYLRDVRSGNVTVADVIRGTLIGVFNKIQGLLCPYLPTRLLIRRGLKYPFIGGELRRTPKAILNLQPGDLVEIKSKEEIVATLDTNNRNRGLLFDREMVGFCGLQRRVLSRVNKIIDEKTGQMLELNSDCLMLDNVYCRGGFNQFCPRGIYSFWREIWLKKVVLPVDTDAADVQTGAACAVMDRGEGPAATCLVQNDGTLGRALNHVKS
jgi:hypothetical protein